MTSDQISALAAVIALIISIRSWFVGYDHQKRLDILRTDLDRQLHVYKLTSEKEFEILSELWSAFVAVSSTTLGIRTLISSSHSPSLSKADELGQRRQRFAQFEECLSKFFEVYERNRPFYPEAIHDLLEGFAMKAAVHADDATDDTSLHDYMDRYAQTADEMHALKEKLCEAIRKEYSISHKPLLNGSNPLS